MVAQLTSETTQPYLFNPNGSMYWSQAEEQRLFNTYKNVSESVLKILFPNRTKQAIQTHASRLKIKRPGRHWTHKEDKLLVELKQQNMKYKDIMCFFRERSIGSLKNRYMRLLRAE